MMCECCRIVRNLSNFPLLCKGFSKKTKTTQNIKGSLFEYIELQEPSTTNLFGAEKLPSEVRTDSTYNVNTVGAGDCIQ